MRRALALGALLGLALPAAASATDGNLYPYGGAIWAVGPQFAAGQSGETYTIGSPALPLALAGSKWEMNWGCPVPGSEIADVGWGALRYQAVNSSMQLEVSSLGTILWAEPDSGIPPVPDNTRYYLVGLPPGICNVHLRLRQVEERAQDARTYAIDHPGILVRDLTAPTALVRGVTGDWINGSANSVRIDWSASDNFGSDGIGLHHLSVAGIEKWAAPVGQGDFAAIVDLNGVPDGWQPVHLQVDGDGTGAGAADAAIAVDRTPPSIGGLGVDYSGAAGRATFGWVPDDNFSGVASSEVLLNQAADGTASGGWTTVLARVGAGGQRAVDVDARAVGDGLHAWAVRATDVAGNVRQSPGAGSVVVDSTPPALELAPVPSAWTARLTVGWTASDNLQGVLGLGPAEIEANAVTDGGQSGAWIPLHAAVHPAGRAEQAVALRSLADGVHAVRVRVRNGAPFGSLASERVAIVRVDSTSPSVSAVTFTATGADKLAVAFTAQDPRAGVAAATVQWRHGDAWETLLTAPVGEGAQRLVADTSGVPDGAQRFRLLVTDAAGNASEVAGGLGVDHSGPSVSGMRLEGPPWRLFWTQVDPVGGFGKCPTAIQVSGPGTRLQWREIDSVPAKSGAQSVALDVDGLAAGAYRVRVVACDASGSRASAETGGLMIGSGAAKPGAGSTARDPLAVLKTAKLTIRVDHGHLERFKGRPYQVRRIRYGDVVEIRGRLRTSSGAPIARSEVQVRGYRGRVLGRADTARDGTFRITVRPEANGPLTVGVPAGRKLLPTRTGTGIRVLVRPRIHLTVSSRQAVAFGAPIVFRGLVRPAPALLGGYARKGVVLEWRDPLRHVWRPVVNGRVARDGRFTFTWRFGVKNLTVPMRVRVPIERGWPLGPGLTAAIPIKVR